MTNEVIIAIVSAAAGGVVTLLTTLALDRRKEKREDRLEAKKMQREVFQTRPEITGEEGGGFLLEDLSTMKIAPEIAERGHEYSVRNKVSYICLDGMEPDHPLRKELVRLTIALRNEMNFPYESQILLLHKLNSEEKTAEFFRWAKSRVREDKLEATEAEICRAAVKINRGLAP